MSKINDLYGESGFVSDLSEKEIYKLNPLKGHEGKYEATIRFIPFWKNPGKSLVSKCVAYVVNPMTPARGMYVDDPSSIGQQSIIRDMFFAIMKIAKENNLERYKDFAKEHLSSSNQYASLIQIIDDPYRPQLNGKIMVLCFGQQIYDKINAEKTPSATNQSPVSPHDPINGRYFHIVCKKKSNSKMNTYEDSAFFTNIVNNQVMSSAMYMPDANGQMSQINEDTDGDAFTAYLEGNSPDLSKYDYHPMTQDQQNYVDEAIRVVNDMLQKGTAGLPTTSLGYGMAQNNTPTFPGASAGGYVQTQPTAQPMGNPMMPAQPMAPAAPVSQPMAPAQPMQTTMGVNPMMPAQPMAPATPVAQPMAAPQPMAPAAPAMPQTPNVAPATSPETGYKAPGISGNIQNILDQI